jgi:hypothetical protein
MMLKRKDGSYSKRGLWDNIRKKAAENKAAGKTGKEPTQEMLKQDSKIKEDMKSKSNSKSPSKKMGGGYKAPQYQMGGDMIEPSKEINFDRPMMRKGGSKPDYLDIDKDGNKTEPMKAAASTTKMIGGGEKRPKSAKIDARAENKMTKAKKNWTKAEQARVDSEANPGTTGNLERYASRMYNKAARQEDRAKDLKAKAARTKEVEEVKKYGGIKKK